MRIPAEGDSNHDRDEGHNGFCGVFPPADQFHLLSEGSRRSAVHYLLGLAVVRT